MDSWVFKPRSTIVLFEKLKKNSWKLGKICNIGQGMTTGKNDVFIVDEVAIRRHNLETDILKKYVKTKDIKRYQILYRNLFMIYSSDIDIKDYSNLKKYLELSRNDLEKRYEFAKGNCKWFEIAQPRNKDLFDNAKEKILTPTYSTSNKFAFDACDKNSNFYGMTDTYIIVPREDNQVSLKFIYALLNSKLMEFYHHNNAKLKRDGYYEYVTGPISKLPIHKIDLSQTKEKYIHDKFVELADKMPKLYKKLNSINTDFTHYLSLRTIIGNLELRDFIDTVGVSEKAVLNEANTLKATIKKVDIERHDDWLIFKVDAVRDSGIKFKDVEVLKVKFKDRNLKEFIYHSVKNLKKKNLGKGFIFQKLRMISLPKFSSNSRENWAMIDELMGTYLKAVDEKERTEKEIKETDQTIDKMVYKLYGLTEGEIKIVEER